MEDKTIIRCHVVQSAGAELDGGKQAAQIRQSPLVLSCVLHAPRLVLTKGAMVMVKITDSCLRTSDHTWIPMHLNLPTERQLESL